MLCLLLAHGINAPAMIPQILYIQQRVLGLDLLNAAHDGDEAQVNALITYGIEVDTLDLSGFTAFDYAADNNHQSICRALSRAFVLRKMLSLAQDSFERMICLMRCYNRIGRSLSIPVPKDIMKVMCLHSDELGKELLYGAFFQMTETEDFLRRASSTIGLDKTIEILSHFIKTTLLDFFDTTRQKNVSLLIQEHGSFLLAKLLNSRMYRIKMPDLIPRWIFQYIKPDNHLLKVLSERRLVPRINTPLHRAVLEETPEKVEYLLQRGADYDEKEIMGFTPLLFALLHGRLTSAKVLLTYGAKCNTMNNFGMTPLQCAAGHGYEEIVAMLLAKGADITFGETMAWTVLHFGAQGGNVPVLKLLLKAGASLHATDKQGVTALHLAARSGNLEAVTYLASCGAAINASTHDGVTPLHEAACQNRQEVVTFLLKHGACIDYEDTQARRAIHYAAQGTHTDLVSLLLDNGATCSEYGALPAQNDPNRALLFYAAITGRTKVCQEALRGVCFRMLREHADEAYGRIYCALCCIKRITSTMQSTLPRDVLGSIFGTYTDLAYDVLCYTNRFSSSLVETARRAQKLGLTRVTYILEVHLGIGLKAFLEVRGPFQLTAYEIAHKNSNFRVAALVNSTMIPFLLQELL